MPVGLRLDIRCATAEIATDLHTDASFEMVILASVRTVRVGS
jgi:hypothetical protein